MKSKDVMIVGQDTGISSRAHKIMHEALIKAGFDPQKLEYAYALEEAPPEGKNVTTTMIRAGREQLMKRIKKKNPKLLLLMGNTPCESYLEQKGIRALRGKPVLAPDGRIAVPVYHPNYALHDDKWISVIEQDVQRLRECFEFGGIPEEKELNYEVVDTWPKVLAMLKDLSGVVAVDLETTRLYPFTTQQDILIEEKQASAALLASHRGTHGSNNLPKVVCMQFGTRKRQWVVPLETAGIWSVDDQKKIVKLATRKLKNCINVFHNGKFDALWMLVRFGAKWRVDQDTMLKHFLIDENDQHGLKYLAQKLLGVPDWDIGNGEGQKTTWSLKNAKYAAHDVFYTRKLHFILTKEIREDEDVHRVYKKIMMPCVQLFIEAEHRGVFIEQNQMDDAEAYLREEVATAGKNLERWEKKAVKVETRKKEARYGRINWGSADQLGDLLFNQLKIPPVEKTAKGKFSVSESVLLRIDHPMVGDLLKWRAANKQLSSFIDGWRPYLDASGRIHPVFKLHGTVTGRLSCEHPNLQQVPRDPRIRTLITAPPGWSLIEMDLSQIELRIAAELAGEQNLLNVFAAGGDPHWQTAIREIERGAGYKTEVIKTAKLHQKQNGIKYKKMSYGKSIEYILAIGGDAAVDTIKSWAESKALEPFMDWKETRKKAKAINFGYLYGMWWKKFKIYARDNYGVTVTDEEAEASREAFFELYPGFPAWHNRQRRFSQVNGYVRSLSGRKRRLPAAASGRDSPQRREAQRQAINSPVQSFANELNLMAALQMRKEFSKKWFRLVGTVHDAVLIEVRNDHVAHVWNRGLEIMSKPELLKSFDIDMSVPIEAEAKIGPWAAGKDLNKWLQLNSYLPKQRGKHARMPKNVKELLDA